MIIIKIALLISITVSSIVFSADLVSRYLDSRDDKKFENIKKNNKFRK